MSFQDVLIFRLIFNQVNCYAWHSQPGYLLYHCQNKIQFKNCAGNLLIEVIAYNIYVSAICFVFGLHSKLQIKWIAPKFNTLFRNVVSRCI